MSWWQTGLVALFSALGGGFAVASMATYCGMTHDWRPTAYAAAAAFAVALALLPALIWWLDR